MSILSVIIVCVIVGALLYLANMIPMDATVRKIMHVAVAVILVLWLLNATGILGSLDVPVRVR